MRGMLEAAFRLRFYRACRKDGRCSVAGRVRRSCGRAAVFSRRFRLRAVEGCPERRNAREAAAARMLRAVFARTVAPAARGGPRHHDRLYELQHPSCGGIRPPSPDDARIRREPGDRRDRGAVRPPGVGERRGRVRNRPRRAPRPLPRLLPPASRRGCALCRRARFRGARHHAVRESVPIYRPDRRGAFRRVRGAWHRARVPGFSRTVPRGHQKEQGVGDVSPELLRMRVFQGGSGRRARAAQGRARRREGCQGSGRGSAQGGRRGRTRAQPGREAGLQRETPAPARAVEEDEGGSQEAGGGIAGRRSARKSEAAPGMRIAFRTRQRRPASNGERIP